MKSKMFSTFVLFFLLSFVFFSGCDNGLTDNGLTDNVAPIDPPYANIPDVNSYRAIFVGESHDNREIYNVYPRLMRYYYSLGVRDFAFELGYGSVLLVQHYIDTGNEECLQVLFRNLKGSMAYNQEYFYFFKELHKWNSSLKDKIKLHSFDVEHQFESARAAMWFIVFKKYKRIDGIPAISVPGNSRDLVMDFKNNRSRYSSLSPEDIILLERIILSVEQSINYYDNRSSPSVSDSMREQYMIDNFREIIRNTENRKVFATMGWNHASLNGQGDGASRGYSMASILKSEISIGSIVLRQQADPNRWQYTIWINENLKTTPFNSTYAGNWPYD